MVVDGPLVSVKVRGKCVARILRSTNLRTYAERFMGLFLRYQALAEACGTSLWIETVRVTGGRSPDVPPGSVPVASAEDEETV